MEGNEVSSVSNDELSVDATGEDVIGMVALPSPKKYMASAVMSGVADNDCLALGGALCFDVESSEVEGFVDKYAIEGWLRTDIPLACTHAWAWSNQCAVYDGELIRRPGAQLHDVCREFNEKVICGRERLRVDGLCPLGKSMFIHRTRGQVGYIEALCSMPCDRFDMWKGASCVDIAACM